MCERNRVDANKYLNKNLDSKLWFPTHTCTGSYNVRSELTQTSHGHKFLCPRSICWNKEQSQELAKKNPLLQHWSASHFWTGKWKKREVKRESSWYAVHSWLTSSWFHHRVLYIGIWYFLQRKARDWSFFLELSDF